MTQNGVSVSTGTPALKLDECGPSKQRKSPKNIPDLRMWNVNYEECAEPDTPYQVRVMEVLNIYMSSKWVSELAYPPEPAHFRLSHQNSEVRGLRFPPW